MGIDSDCDGWRINREHLEASKQTYINLATQDGGSLETTVFGGFSNGGAQALVTGLQTPCAGILALSCSLFGFREFDEAALTSKPVLFCTGEKDPHIPVSEVEADKAFIAGRTKCDVQVRTFKCMGHESCEQELAVCANWLAKVLAVDGDDDALGAAAGVNFIK